MIGPLHAMYIIYVQKDAIKKLLPVILALSYII